MTETNVTNAKHGFWEFKKYQEHEWFRFLIILLILTVVAYFVSHLVVRKSDPNAGYEYETLGKVELQHINRIYFDSADTSVTPSDVSVAYRTNRVIQYVRNHFNDKADTVQLEQIRHYLQPASALEAVSFWGTVRLRIRSYFWLVGPEVYFEIIFWTVLGVISSLLYNLSVVSRNRTTDIGNPQTTFDSSEIPYQFAKIWYAPISTLVIVLGYNFFQDENIADISSSKGVIVFAFIGGFYSARLIAFLDRLKEVLLPISSTSDLPVQKSVAAPLQNITISLQLDSEALPPEMANEVAEIGFANATVTLENNENGEIVKAERTGEDQASTFTVAAIKPGKYTIKATWSNDVAGQPVTLAGEENAEIKNSDTTITVLMKKDEGEG